MISTQIFIFTVNKKIHRYFKWRRSTSNVWHADSVAFLFREGLNPYYYYAADNNIQYNSMDPSNKMHI